jgi:hypothetical protein
MLWLFLVTCYSAAALFFSLLGLYEHLAGPVIDWQVVTLSTLATGFLILPFVRRIRIGPWLEVDHRLDKLKEEVTEQAERISHLAVSFDTRYQAYFNPTLKIELGEKLAELQDRHTDEKVGGLIRAARRVEESTTIGLIRIGIEIEACLQQLFKANKIRLPSLILKSATIGQMATYLESKDIISGHLLDHLLFFVRARNAIIHGSSFSQEERELAMTVGTLINKELKAVSQGRQETSF